MASNGYQYECRHEHIHTHSLLHTHTHLHAHTHAHSYRRQGHCGGSQVLARYHIKNNTSLTQNAKVRIYKLHMHTYTNTHTYLQTNTHTHTLTNTHKTSKEDN